MVLPSCLRVQDRQVLVLRKRQAPAYLITLEQSKTEVGTASSSRITSTPEPGPSGGGEERAEGSLRYMERGRVTYIFSQAFFWLQWDLP